MEKPHATDLDMLMFLPPPEPRPGEGWVYIAAWQERGPVKIGRAAYLGRRLPSLLTGSPHPVTFYAAIWAARFASVIEDRTMKLLAPKRIARSWFACSVAKACEALDAAEDEYLGDLIADDFAR